MLAAKVHQLVDYLDSQLAQSKSGLQQLLLERAIVLVLLMWETPMRGNNHGKLTWSDFFLPEGQPLTPCLALWAPGLPW